MARPDKDHYFMLPEHHDEARESMRSLAKEADLRLLVNESSKRWSVSYGKSLILVDKPFDLVFYWVMGFHTALRESGRL